jgi:hypothetical protein
LVPLKSNAIQFQIQSTNIIIPTITSISNDTFDVIFASNSCRCDDVEDFHTLGVTRIHIIALTIFRAVISIDRTTKLVHSSLEFAAALHKINTSENTNIVDITSRINTSPIKHKLINGYVCQSGTCSTDNNNR